jgi:predicted DNA-binding transcriptional regulator YafY
VLSEQPDDAIIVTVTACAELEMGWHLFTCGDAVEVLEPQSLRELPAQKRRKAWRQA